MMTTLRTTAALAALALLVVGCGPGRPEGEEGLANFGTDLGGGELDDGSWPAVVPESSFEVCVWLAEDEIRWADEDHPEDPANPDGLAPWHLESSRPEVLGVGETTAALHRRWFSSDAASYCASATSLLPGETRIELRDEEGDLEDWLGMEVVEPVRITLDYQWALDMADAVAGLQVGSEALLRGQLFDEQGRSLGLDQFDVSLAPDSGLEARAVGNLVFIDALEGRPASVVEAGKRGLAVSFSLHPVDAPATLATGVAHRLFDPEESRATWKIAVALYTAEGELILEPRYEASLERGQAELSEPRWNGVHLETDISPEPVHVRISADGLARTVHLRDEGLLDTDWSDLSPTSDEEGCAQAGRPGSSHLLWLALLVLLPVLRRRSASRRPSAAR